MENLKESCKGRQMYQRSWRANYFSEKHVFSDQLESKCDNNEQYRRCTGIQILGIEVPEHESNDNVMAVVKSCHEKINQIVYRPCNQVGSKYTDENSGKKIRSVIAQFKSWKSRKDLLGQEILLTVRQNQV